MERNFVLALLCMFGVSLIPIPSYSQSYEKVIGYVSGSQDAGETYELYKSSSDSFRDYLAGWKYVGEKDKRVTYSYDELYNICLNEAKRKYGSDYPNLYLKDFKYDKKEEDLEDEEYHTHVTGSTTEYRKEERRKRVYIYSATVVVAQ